MHEWHVSCVILGKWLLPSHPWLLWPWFHPCVTILNQLKISCYFFFDSHETLNICHIFPTPWKFGLMTFNTKFVFLFEKLIWFSWFGKFSIHNVSFFSTTNLLIFNFISSQSTFVMFVMLLFKCIHEFILNNLKGNFFCSISIMPSWICFLLWHFNHYKMWK